VRAIAGRKGRLNRRRGNNQALEHFMGSCYRLWPLSGMVAGVHR